MTRRRNPRQVLVVLAMTASTVSGCATGPAPPKPVPRQADPSFGRMAPIPNPTDEAPRQATRPAPRAADAPAPRAPTAQKPSAPAPAAPKPGVTPGRDPAKARTLRAQGLEQLNRGAIDRAQDLLRQALQQDPGNALIQRDLDRATRIGRAVKAKP